MTDQVNPVKKLYNKDGEIEWILLRPNEYERLMLLSQAAGKTPPSPELTAEEVAKENNAFQEQLKAKLEKKRVECPHCGCSIGAHILDSHIKNKCPKSPQGIQAGRSPKKSKSSKKSKRKKKEQAIPAVSRLRLSANYLRAQRDSLSD